MRPLPLTTLGAAVVVAFGWGWWETGPAAVALDRPDALSIETCFEPEGKCTPIVVAAIDAAEQEILVAAYALTEPSIAQALADAKRRGLDVEVIADRGVPCERHSGMPALMAAGVPVWIDSKVHLAHAKTMVIDHAVTLMGSYNWTVNAAFNSEDLNVVRSAAVAAQYEQHWRNRRDASTPYRMREDWCPAGSAVVR